MARDAVVITLIVAAIMALSYCRVLTRHDTRIEIGSMLVAGAPR